MKSINSNWNYIKVKKMEENGISLLKQEMTNEEIHVKVNAIHRLKTVILSIG